MNSHGQAEGWLITSIRKDKKERRTYLVFAGADDPLLSVHEDILIRFRLMKEGRITAVQLEQIKREDGLYRAYALAVSYLGAKPRTRKQIEQYLARKEMDVDAIQYTLDRLETERLVDDEQYARQFAASRLQSGLKGRLMIRQELQQRGVSKSAAADALSELDRDSELAAAISLASKKSRSLKGDPKERGRKLMGFLLRRGFPGDIVKEAVRSVDLGSSVSLDEEDDGVLLDN